METIESLGTLMAIIFIAFGVLQIILFFKVWGMTENVKLLKKNLVDIELKHRAWIEFAKGNKVKAKEILDTNLYVDIVKICLENNEYTFNNWMSDLKANYTSIYRKLDFEMPDLDRFKDKNNIPF